MLLRTDCYLYCGSVCSVGLVFFCSCSDFLSFEITFDLLNYYFSFTQKPKMTTEKTEVTRTISHDLWVIKSELNILIFKSCVFTVSEWCLILIYNWVLVVVRVTWLSFSFDSSKNVWMLFFFCSLFLQLTVSYSSQSCFQLDSFQFFYSL